MPPERYPRLAMLFGPDKLATSSPAEEPPKLWSRFFGSYTGLSMFGLLSYTLLPENCSPGFFSDAKFFMLTYSKVWFLALLAISNGLSLTVLPLSLAIVIESALPDILLFS